VWKKGIFQQRSVEIGFKFYKCYVTALFVAKTVTLLNLALKTFSCDTSADQLNSAHKHFSGGGGLPISTSQLNLFMFETNIKLCSQSFHLI